MTQYDPGTVSPLRVAGCESWAGGGGTAQSGRASVLENGADTDS